MQVEKHSTWPHTLSLSRTRTQKTGSLRQEELLTCHMHLSSTVELPLSANSLTPVLNPTSRSHCYLNRAFTEHRSWISVLQSESSLQTCWPNQKSNVSLVCRWNRSHIYQTRPMSSSLHPTPQGAGRTRSDWHIGTFIATIAITLPHIYPTHTHTRTERDTDKTHTSATLPLMTHYTADKIPHTDNVTLPQKRSTKCVWGWGGGDQSTSC